MLEILTRKERQQLIKRHRHERDKRICDRIKAVLAYDAGHTYSEISDWLLLDDETIRRHIKDYCSTNKLLPENGGSDPHLSKLEAKQLIEHLREKTYIHVKDICVYVKAQFNKEYSVSGMTNWLHANNFRYKKPHPVPAKADKEKQEEFIKSYNTLKASTAGREPIYFADSVHPAHQTKLSYGWIPKGERKHIAMTARQRRMSIMGAICLENHSIVSSHSDTVNSQSIINFIKLLRKKHPKDNKLHIIFDNASYNRSTEVQAELKRLNIEAHYLPAYSPNLNPIERLWKIMHEHVTYNKYYKSFKDFTESILHFFRHIGKKKKLLRSRITDNFQLIDAPNFAS